MAATKPLVVAPRTPMGPRQLSRFQHLDFDNLPLCGREKEMKMLTSAYYDEDRQNKIKTRILLVEGPSGCGKSVLIKHFQETVLMMKKKNGKKDFFVFGKQEELTDHPFTALREATNDLLSQLLDDQSLDWKEIIDAEMTLNQKRLLVSLSPLMARLCEMQQPTRGQSADDNTSVMPGADRSVSSTWGSQFLRLAIRSLFRIVSRERRVILVQDDIQWAKRDYWSVLGATIIDSGSENVLFIGTHRPEPEMPEFRRLIAGKEDQVTSIELKNLSVDAVKDMVQLLTRRDDEDPCLELAKILRHRTGGNPMFLVQFIGLLQDRRLIFYAVSSFMWEWDIQKILTDTSIAENLVDVFASKIDELPVELKTVMITAANIGLSRFDIQVLHCIRQSSFFKGLELKDPDESIDNLKSLLQLAVAEGLLETIGASQFKFVHDKIREVAKVMLHGNFPDVDKFHIALGNALIQKEDELGEDYEQDGTDLIILGSQHLNCGLAAMTSETERLDLIRLNLRAAQAAFALLWFTPAKEHLAIGMEIARTLGGWQMHYDQTLEISTFYAEVLYCSGDQEMCFEITDEILKNATENSDAFPALRFKVHCCYNLGRDKEGNRLASTALKQLGFPFPRNKVLAAAWALKNVAQLKAVAREITEEKLLKMPVLEDENVLKAVQFYWALFEMAAVKADMVLQAFVMVVMIKITLKYGNHDFSAVALTSLAMIMAFSGDYEEADRIGQIAMKFSDEVEGPPKVLCLIGNCFFNFHWKHPLTNTLDMTLKAKEIVLSTGNIPMMFIASMTYTLNYIQSGLSLEPLSRDVSRLSEMLRDLNLRIFDQLFESAAQFVLNLTGKANGNPTELNGAVLLDRDASLKSYKSDNNMRATNSVYLFRMMMAYILDDVDLALKMSSQLYSAAMEGPSALLPFRFFFQGLVALSGAKKIKGTEIFGLLERRSTLPAQIETNVEEGVRECLPFCVALRGGDCLHGAWERVDCRSAGIRQSYQHSSKAWSLQRASHGE